MTLTQQQIADLLDFQNGAANHGDKETVALIDRALEQHDPDALALSLKLLQEAEERLNEWGQ